MSGKRFDPVIFLSKIAKTSTITCRVGDVIFKQDDPADLVYYLKSGSIKESVVSEHGKEAVVGILEPGQFFGTSCLDGGPVRHSTTRAMHESVVISIKKDIMRKALDSELAFAQLFMAYLLHHNAQIEAEKVNLLFNSSEKRLAHRLLLLSHVNEGRAQPISSAITQEMLADMIGTTRPRVNYFLNRFRKLGFITYGQDGVIRVNPSLLVAVLQDKASISDDTETN